MKPVQAVSLAHMLKVRLERIMPPNFQVEVEGDGLAISFNNDAGVGLGQQLWSEGDSDKSNIELVVRSILSGVQDVITLNTKDIWPPNNKGLGPTDDVLPLLDMRWKGRKLDIWFGNEHDPALRLMPINLDELAH